MEEKVFREAIKKRSIMQHEPIGMNEPMSKRIRNRSFYFTVIILLTINITLIVTNLGIWFMAAHQKLFFLADFTSFYTGYYLVRVGEGTNLYDVATQAKYQEQFMGGFTFKGGVLLFSNPLFIAIILAALSYLC